LRLGLLSASLGTMSTEAVVAHAASVGLKTLELAAWPQPLDRPFTAAHAPVGESASSLRDTLDEYGVMVAALAYYDNPLDPDEVKRVRVHEHLGRVIDFAGELGCPLVGTFIGRDPNRSVAENLAAAERTFPHFVNRAAEREVRLMIENCSMHGWHPDGYPGNLAYSPELWEWLTELGLWLNFDPSHLPPLGIDPVDALAEHVSRVVHLHAKDVEISVPERNRLSIHGRAVGGRDPWDTGWWSYRLPGEGEIDWDRLFDILAEADFEGAICIEHEDERGPASTESILAGVDQAAAFLRRINSRHTGVGIPQQGR
jgi:sugar phosphate isomerase/epimerase